MTFSCVALKNKYMYMYLTTFHSHLPRPDKRRFEIDGKDGKDRTYHGLLVSVSIYLSLYLTWEQL